MELWHKGGLDTDDVRELVPDFKQTFKALLGVMTLQDRKLRAAEQKKAKLAAQTQGSDFPEQPKTPDRPTIPDNPKFSSSSKESKDEPQTRKLLEEFLSETLGVLKKDFRLLKWQQSGHKVEIAETYLNLGNDL